MANTGRRTIARDSVFRRTAAAPGSQDAAIEEEAPTRQTAVWLADEDIDLLDDMRRQARKNRGKAVTRSALIRALIEVARQLPPDLTGLASDRELPQRLLRARR